MTSVSYSYGSRDDSWLPVVSKSLCPVVGTIQVLGKENIQPDLLEVRLAAVKKNKKKKNETAGLIKAVYEMIDKRGDITSHIAESLQLQSITCVSKDEMTFSDT